MVSASFQTLVEGVRKSLQVCTKAVLLRSDGCAGAVGGDADGQSRRARTIVGVLAMLVHRGEERRALLASVSGSGVDGASLLRGERCDCCPQRGTAARAALGQLGGPQARAAHFGSASLQARARPRVPPARRVLPVVAPRSGSRPHASPRPAALLLRHRYASGAQDATFSCSGAMRKFFWRSALPLEKADAGSRKVWREALSVEAKVWLPSIP